MKKSMMLGSVTYPEFLKKEIFNKNLTEIENAINLPNSEYECEKFTAQWQNLNLKSNSRFSIFKVIFFHLFFETKIYIGKSKIKFITKNLSKICIRILRDFFLLTKEEFTKKHLINHLRIKYITDKHLRVIGNFLDSESDYLIVCEDDIENSVPPSSYLPHIIKIAEEEDCPLFITICNNSSYEKVSDYFGGKIQPYRDSKDWLKIDFFVNGCAMYLMNRQMAEIINEYMINNTIYRNCAIDWLLTLIGRNFQTENIICLIPVENFVVNGSRS